PAPELPDSIKYHAAAGRRDRQQPDTVLFRLCTRLAWIASLFPGLLCACRFQESGYFFHPLLPCFCRLHGNFDELTLPGWSTRVAEGHPLRAVLHVDLAAHAQQKTKSREVLGAGRKHQGGAPFAIPGMDIRLMLEQTVYPGGTTIDAGPHQGGPAPGIGGI